MLLRILRLNYPSRCFLIHFKRYFHFGLYRYVHLYFYRLFSILFLMSLLLIFLLLPPFAFISLLPNILLSLLRKVFLSLLPVFAGRRHSLGAWRFWQPFLSFGRIPVNSGLAVRCWAHSLQYRVPPFPTTTTSSPTRDRNFEKKNMVFIHGVTLDAWIQFRLTAAVSLGCSFV